MSDATLDRVAVQAPAPDVLQRVLKMGVALAFAALTALAFMRNVNWDEFYFLSHIHAYLDGRLDRPMQTVFVHGFTWLDRLPGHEMEQIFAARLVMVGFVALTTASIYHIARHLSATTPALIAALAFLTSGFTLVYGGSFRADPMAAALATASIALLMTTRMGPLHVLAVATFSALAMLVTVKTALFVPAYLAALIWRMEERGMVLRILGTGILALAIAAPLYSWHAAGIVPAPGADTASNARDAVSTSLLRSGFFPRSKEALTWSFLSLGALPLVLAGLRAARPARLRVVLILFAFPLLSIIIYRNAFPYFFPFAVPLLMVSAALGAQNLRGTRTLQACLVLMIAGGLGQAAFAFRDGTALQRATLAEVHRIFPQPVPYIGDSGMVSSFPRVGFFMSGWGMQSYLAADTPVFSDLIATHRPPMLLANKSVLAYTMRVPETGEEQRLLLAEDHDLLRQAYVHYSGSIYLAGGEAQLSSGSAQLSLPFPGTYRVNSPVPIMIDGRPVNGGDVLELQQTDLMITGMSGTVVQLIWDTGVQPSPKALPRFGVYVPFWNLFR